MTNTSKTVFWRVYMSEVNWYSSASYFVNLGNLSHMKQNLCLGQYLNSKSRNSISSIDEIRIFGQFENNLVSSIFSDRSEPKERIKLRHKRDFFSSLFTPFSSGWNILTPLNGIQFATMVKSWGGWKNRRKQLRLRERRNRSRSSSKAGTTAYRYQATTIKQVICSMWSHNVHDLIKYRRFFNHSKLKKCDNVLMLVPTYFWSTSYSASCWTKCQIKLYLFHCTLMTWLLWQW